MLLQGVVQSKAVTSGLTWPNHGAVAHPTTGSNSMSNPFLRTGPASAHALSFFGDDSASSKLLSIVNQGFHGVSQQRRSCQRLVCNGAASGNGSNGPKMVVAITGATGFVGSKLVDKLVADGHEVRILTRDESKARSAFPERKYPGVKVGEESRWAELIKGSTGVVNLAGPPISTRWTPEVKADIKNCRVAVTGKVVQAINSVPKEERPAVLVSSTAVGFYGTSETSAFDETSPSGNDYLAEVCKAWEASARRVRQGTRLVLLRTGIVLDGEEGGSLALSETTLPEMTLSGQNNNLSVIKTAIGWAILIVSYLGVSTGVLRDATLLTVVCRVWEEKAKELENGTRLVLIRTGIVLDKDGGALENVRAKVLVSRLGQTPTTNTTKMVPIFSIFAGGPLGSGKQWFSWVHRDDLVGMIIESLKNPAYEGVINGTAPNPVRMAEMCDRLGAILGRPSWLPVPEFALKAILGEGATVVLEGQRVLPKRAQELGFSFKYRYISDALKAILTT